MAGKRINDQSLILLRTAVEAGITSPNELAHLMGHADVETAAFTRMHESFDYRSVEQLLRAVRSADDRFGRDAVEAAVASRDPQRIAEVMYGNRPRMENDQPGDGWRFHGRGFLQFTGRFNYRTFGERYGFDLVNNPDLAADPEISARLAVAYWFDRVSPEERRDIAAAGEKINGGGNGANERVSAARGWARTITPELVADIQAGHGTLASLARHPAVQRIDGPMSTGDYGPAVATLQQHLVRLGHTAADGRALDPDGDFGRRTREAVQAFQRAHDLPANGIAGPETLEAVERAASRLLGDARHPHNPLYTRTLAALHAAEAARDLPAGPHSEKLAAALTVSALEAGIGRVDRVELNDTGTLARVVQASPLRDEPGLNRYGAPVDTAAAVLRPLQETSEQARPARQDAQALLAPAPSPQAAAPSGPEPRVIQRPAA
jgi:putative chitinase